MGSSSALPNLIKCRQMLQNENRDVGEYFQIFTGYPLTLCHDRFSVHDFKYTVIAMLELIDLAPASRGWGVQDLFAENIGNTRSELTIYLEIQS